MTDTNTDAMQCLANLSHLTVLVDQLRSIRERIEEKTGRRPSFAEVVDTVAGTNREAWAQDYLKELSEILDNNSPEAVDDDLEARWLDAASRLEEPEATGLPKLLT